MMKKRLILCIGVVIAVLLLFCTAAGAAQTDARQPSKTAAQWQKDGYTVISLSGGSAADPDHTPSLQYKGFLVLAKDVHYIKESTGNGIVRDANTFTLSKYQKSPAKAGTPEGTDPRYCIAVGGKFYFGTLKEKSGNRYILNDDMVSLDMSMIDSLTNFNALAYTVGAWIDINQDFEFDIKPDNVPMHFDGNIRIKMDHTSYDPGATEDTEHKLRTSIDVQIYNAGLQSDEEVTATYDIPIVQYEEVDLVSIGFGLDEFKGALTSQITSHFGFTFYFYTYGVPCDFDRWHADLDDDNKVDAQVSKAAAKGHLKAGFNVGPQASVDFGLFQIKVGLTYQYGVEMLSTPEGDRFDPPDKKDRWHACEQCMQEDMRIFNGPASIYGWISGMDNPLEWDILDPFYSDPFYTFHWSDTFDEIEEGPCPHWGYRLDVTAQNQDGEPLKSVDVSYKVVPSHYQPQSTGKTDAAGKASLYIPKGKYTVEAVMTSPQSPQDTQVRVKTIDMAAETQQLTFTFDVPTKYIRFRNPSTGTATDWPDDITYLPFYSDHVKLPGNVPRMPGWHFMGWNDKKDGTGKTHVPGQTIVTRDNVTLWAQWRKAENTWLIVYDANGGSSAPGPQIVPDGEGAYLSNEPARAETLVFRGWTTDLREPEPEYQPGDFIAYDRQKPVVVLHALWEINPAHRPVHITYDANGMRGAELPADFWLIRGSWTQLEPATLPPDSAHTFLGWSEKPDAREPEYVPERAYFFDEDTKLYALWSACYKVIYGADSVWVKGSGVTQRFIANGDIRDFRELRIDEKPITDGVEISSGSTIADISPEAMEKLSVGTHTITFQYEDGEASAAFTIQKALPPTGDRSDPALWLILIASGVAGIALVCIVPRIAVKKKK